MNEVRIMLAILVELDSKRLGGTMLILPFEVEWLTGNTCRELLHHVLVHHLDHRLEHTSQGALRTVLCSTPYMQSVH